MTEQPTSDDYQWAFDLLAEHRSEDHFVAVTAVVLGMNLDPNPIRPHTLAVYRVWRGGQLAQSLSRDARAGVLR